MNIVHTTKLSSTQQNREAHRNQTGYPYTSPSSMLPAGVGSILLRQGRVKDILVQPAMRLPPYSCIRGCLVSDVASIRALGVPCTCRQMIFSFGSYCQGRSGSQCG